MPTCEPKRGHVCGNGSLRPAQEEQTGLQRQNPALTSWEPQTTSLASVSS